MSFLMLTYWLALNLLQTFTPGRFVTKQKMTLIELEEDETYYKEEQIPMDKLFTAYKIVNKDKFIGDADINNYVTGLWFQDIDEGTDDDDGTVTAYLPILCKDAVELQDIQQS